MCRRACARRSSPPARAASPISHFPFGERYVVVNLPATSVEAVENGVGRPPLRGDRRRRRPSFAADRRPCRGDQPQSNLDRAGLDHQERDHPAHAARSRLSGAREDPHSRRRGAEVDPKRIDWSTERAANYTLRQDSGAGNSLGSIRIDMPNKLAVYMHDTPSKRLFGADYRFLSHGCVRVQGVYDLAAWLLEGTSGGPAGAWDKDALLAEIKTGAREDIKLTRSTPVIWVYLTGWANADGAANFRNDVYGLDARRTRRRAPRPLRRSTRCCARRPSPPPPNDGWAAAAEPRRSLRRARRRRRARRADGQSRRPLPSPRPDPRPPPLGVAAMDLVPVRVPGPPSQRLGRQLHRAVLSRRADGARRRPPAVLPLSPRRRGGVPPRLRRRRRTERAGDGRRSPPRAARRPCRRAAVCARSPNCPTAR